MYVADSKRLTLAGARAMMAAAMSKAESAGIPISVAIADADPQLALNLALEAARLRPGPESDRALQAAVQGHVDVDVLPLAEAARGALLFRASGSSKAMMSRRDF